MHIIVIPLDGPHWDGARNIKPDVKDTIGDLLLPRLRIHEDSENILIQVVRYALSQGGLGDVG